MTGQQVLPSAIIVVTFLVAVWVALALMSRLSYRRALGPSRTGFVHGASALPYVGRDKALQIASERRMSLLRFLGDTGITGVVRTEFLESPSTLKETEGRSFDDNRAAAAAHTAHLYWQLHDDRLLLMERLMDGIVSLQRSEPKADDLQVTAILAPVRSKIDGNTYPWRAVLHTANPGRIYEYLQSIREWIGIGVDLLPPIGSRPLGHCIGDGSEGQVGGVLRTSSLMDVEYGLTCHHVLADQCGSLHWPTPPNRPQYSEYENGAIDAALISTQSSCFVDPSAARLRISCATAADRERFIGAKVTVNKSPRLGGRTGTILHLADAIPGRDGQQIRAPHLLVIPHFAKRFGITWPLTHRAFSVEGQSGAWVTDEQDSLWFGMIAQGADPPVLISYALEAGFLLDAISRANPQESPFTPLRLG